MEDLYIKYAYLLLKKCLNIKPGQPLVITVPIESIEFIRVLERVAYDLGVGEIYLDFEDEKLKHMQLKMLDNDGIKKSPFWNKSFYNDYAKRDAAFLFLQANEPGLMNDVADDRISLSHKVFSESYQIYRKRQLAYEIPWCFAAVSTTGWAEKVFQNDSNAYQKLWEQIFHMCLVDTNNPLLEWDYKTKKNQQRCNILNQLNLKSLTYTNQLGTNLTIELPKNHIWYGTGKTMPDGTPIIVNMPTEEVFTSPLRTGVNGIVYNSKPLIYNGILIDGLILEFKNGKVVDIKAKCGLESIKQFVSSEENAAYLGEVALVDDNSPISKSGIIFLDTLYDENASCHLALGNGFAKCIKSGTSKTPEELLACGINQSKHHLDFMIGTPDLSINGIDENNHQITIFKDGNFVLEAPKTEALKP